MHTTEDERCINCGAEATYVSMRDDNLIVPAEWRCGTIRGGGRRGRGDGAHALSQFCVLRGLLGCTGRGTSDLRSLWDEAIESAKKKASDA